MGEQGNKEKREQLRRSLRKGIALPEAKMENERKMQCKFDPSFVLRERERNCTCNEYQERTRSGTTTNCPLVSPLYFCTVDLDSYRVYQ